MAAKWPDFDLHRQTWGYDQQRDEPRVVWVARTDTGRPKTPIFSLGLMGVNPELPEDSVREIARVMLDERYSRAHPNGCGAEGGVLETQPNQRPSRLAGGPRT